MSGLKPQRTIGLGDLPERQRDSMGLISPKPLRKWLILLDSLASLGSANKINHLG
jgi:hypothetical protein